ncbi:MAG: signal peptidase I [Thermodesulfobacteriota bacterium]
MTGRSKKEKTKLPGSNKLIENIKFVLYAAILAGILRSTIAGAYYVPSGSMEPTILPGDHLLASKFSYDLKVPFTDYLLVPVSDPQRGDVVVFKNPEGHGSDFIKRIIGLPGETLEVRKKRIYIDGRLINDPWGRNSGGPALGDDFGPVLIPKARYFVMGDNRDNSYDSRLWGRRGFDNFVPRENIRGKARMVLWSWEQFPFSPRWTRGLEIIH